MMGKTDYPITPAIRLLREKKIDFEPCLYDFEERGGTRHSSTALGVAEHAVVKTLVMETDGHEPLIVLMHGDREVSTKQLARKLEVKSVASCDAAQAQKLTGYLVGGISPFGTRTPLPVYAERTIFSLPEIFINGGKRGFLVRINPADLHVALDVTDVDVAIDNH